MLPLDIDRPKRASCIKIRFVIVILTSLCPVVCYISRQNLSIAIVSMVKDTPLPQVTHTSVNNHSISSPSTTGAEVETCPAPLMIGLDGREEVAPVAITYGPKYDWDTADRSFIFQTFFLTYVICQIPGARLAETIGAKWVLAAAAIGSSVLSLISPFAASQHLYLFASVRAIMGCCQAALYPACYVLYSQWLPPNERSQAIPILSVGAYIGSIFASTATGYFSEKPSLGWEWAFYMPSILCAIWAGLWIILGANNPKEHKFISLEEIEHIELNLGVKQESTDVKKSPSWIKIFTSQHVWALMVSFLASNWAFSITLLLLPSYLNDILHVPPFRNGLINSVIYILFCISSPIVGLASSYMIETRPFKMTHIQTRKFFQCTAIFSQAICFTMLPILGCDTNLVLGLLFAQIIFYSFVNGGEVHIASELTHDFAGTIYAIVNCVGSSTGVLVPEVHKWIVRNSHDKFEWSVYFYVAAALTAAGGLVFLFFGRNDLQDFSKEPKKPVIDQLPMKIAVVSSDSSSHTKELQLRI